MPIPPCKTVIGANNILNDESPKEFTLESIRTNYLIISISV
jgi:hypothetical protein